MSIPQFIRDNTNDGRAMCLFLIDVMEGRAEGANVGHRVSAARELLNRVFGKSRSRDLPKPPGSTAHRHKTHQRDASAQTQPIPVAPATSTAVMDEPEPQPEPNRGIVIDNDVDSWLAVYDSELYEFMNECDDADFDPYLAAIDEDYFKSYTACKGPECGVHGEPPDPDFDPNDYHY